MNPRPVRVPSVTFGYLLLATGMFLADRPLRADEAMPYAFRLIKPTGEAEPTAIRFHRTRGDVWVSSKLTGTWKLVHDAQQLPEGDYDVRVVAGINTWYALRADKVSGRSWWLTEGELPIEIKNRDK
jgi:hypothetical protein